MTAREWLDAVEARAIDGARDCGCDDPRSHADIDALPALVAALRAVLEVHADDGEGYCIDCEMGPYYALEPMPHPCPTVAAIDTHLGGAS